MTVVVCVLKTKTLPSKGLTECATTRVSVEDKNCQIDEGSSRPEGLTGGHSASDLGAATHVSRWSFDKIILLKWLVRHHVELGS